MNNKMKNKDFTQKLIILGVLIVLFLFFTVMKKGFASYLNVMTIALSTCVNGLLALAVTFCITSGGIDLTVQGGDVVVATGAVRQEGTSREYMPLEYPAVPDFDVTLALRDGIRTSGLKVHTGVVQAKDSFYGQHRPSVMPIAPKLEYQWDAWKRGGVLCSEMESAALFTVCNYLRVRSGAAFHVIWNQERRDAGIDDVHAPDMEPTLKAVIKGLKLLIQRDREEGK
jgi:uridine phosphorylase